MRCPHCGEETQVLQTFARDDHVIRVRGHRDQSKCWWRSKTIERFDTYASDHHVENAKTVALELRQTINQLKDFDLALKRALNIDTLVNVLDIDRTDDRDKIYLFLTSE